jgi:hypothetical protein
VTLLLPRPAGSVNCQRLRADLRARMPQGTSWRSRPGAGSSTLGSVGRVAAPTRNAERGRFCGCCLWNRPDARSDTDSRQATSLGRSRRRNDGGGTGASPDDGRA